MAFQPPSTLSATIAAVADKDYVITNPTAPDLRLPAYLLSIQVQCLLLFSHQHRMRRSICMYFITCRVQSEWGMGSCGYNLLLHAMCHSIRRSYGCICVHLQDVHVCEPLIERLHIYSVIQCQ